MSGGILVANRHRQLYSICIAGVMTSHGVIVRAAHKRDFDESVFYVWVWCACHSTVLPLRRLYGICAYNKRTLEHSAELGIAAHEALQLLFPASRLAPNEACRQGASCACLHTKIY